jgi:hypothetical protein
MIRCGNYYVIVSDSSGGLNPPVTSQTAEVKVAEPPQIITHPQSLNVYAGQDAIFEVEVSGGFEPYTMMVAIRSRFAGCK